MCVRRERLAVWDACWNQWPLCGCLGVRVCDKGRVCEFTGCTPTAAVAVSAAAWTTCARTAPTRGRRVCIGVCVYGTHAGISGPCVRVVGVRVCDKGRVCEFMGCTLTAAAADSSILRRRGPLAQRLPRREEDEGCVRVLCAWLDGTHAGISGPCVRVGVRVGVSEGALAKVRPGLAHACRAVASPSPKLCAVQTCGCWESS